MKSNKDFFQCIWSAKNSTPTRTAMFHRLRWFAKHTPSHRYSRWLAGLTLICTIFELCQSISNGRRLVWWSRNPPQPETPADADGCRGRNSEICSSPMAGFRLMASIGSKVFRSDFLSANWYEPSFWGISYTCAAVLFVFGK